MWGEKGRRESGNCRATRRALWVMTKAAVEEREKYDEKAARSEGGGMEGVGVGGRGEGRGGKGGVGGEGECCGGSRGGGGEVGVGVVDSLRGVAMGRRTDQRVVVHLD